MADPTKSWNTKHYILAALGGTFLAAVVVIIVSAVLSPARITFSVAHASSTNSRDGKGIYLHVAVAANTTSRRARVKYQSVFVDVQNSTNLAVTEAIIHLKNDTALPEGYQDSAGGGRPRPIVNASVLLVEGVDWVQNFAAGNRGLTVVLTAQVRFKVGVARTRLFDVKVTCPRVVFISDVNATGTSNPVICS